MEAHCIGEQHNGFNLTDDGNDHVTCDGDDDLFETHFNLQWHPARVRRRSTGKKPERGIHPTVEYAAHAFQQQSYTRRLAKASEFTRTANAEPLLGNDRIDDPLSSRFAGK